MAQAVPSPRKYATTIPRDSPIVDTAQPIVHQNYINMHTCTHTDCECIMYVPEEDTIGIIGVAVINFRDSEIITIVIINLIYV